MLKAFSVFISMLIRWIYFMQTCLTFMILMILISLLFLHDSFCEARLLFFISTWALLIKSFRRILALSWTHEIRFWITDLPKGLSGLTWAFFMRFRRMMITNCRFLWMSLLIKFWKFICIWIIIIVIIFLFLLIYLRFLIDFWLWIFLLLRLMFTSRWGRISHTFFKLFLANRFMSTPVIIALIFLQRIRNIP